MSLLQIIISFIYLLIFILLLIFLTSQIWIDISNFRLKKKFGLPYVPTSRKRLKKIIELANLSSKDKVVDLGSGDGRIVIAAAKTGAYAVGYELNLVLVWWSQIKIKILGLSHHAKIYRKDLFKADLENYNVFLLYTMPWVMDEIQKHLHHSKYKNIRIISNTFKFGNIVPTKTAEKEKVYLYEIKKQTTKSSESTS